MRPKCEVCNKKPAVWSAVYSVNSDDYCKWTCSQCLVKLMKTYNIEDWDELYECDVCNSRHEHCFCGYRHCYKHCPYVSTRSIKA